MRYSLLIVLVFVSGFVLAQPQKNNVKEEFTNVTLLPATPVKNQASTGTCWCFSTTSLVESQCIKNEKAEFDLSEMYTVRNIYVEKAKNYVLRQGKAQFSEGGLGHDLVRAISLYGAMPESVYNGLKDGKELHNHSDMVRKLKQFLDDLLRKRPLPARWEADYTAILDEYLGAAPAEFSYKGKTYTPQTFAKEVLKFSAADYVNITSFTHHPYYKPFVLEIPDNFANGSFYNLPLETLISETKKAVEKGYTVMWDADVSNRGFRQNDKGFALYVDENFDRTAPFTPDTKEGEWNAAKRQSLFENLTTEDDHLMHIVGIEKSKSGKLFFIVKNSWGKVGPYDGYIHVSESYFAINTISLVFPKTALSKETLAKIGE